VPVNFLLSVVGVVGVSASGPLMAWIAAPALAIAFWRNALGTAAMLPAALTTGRHELTSLADSIDARYSARRSRA